MQSESRFTKPSELCPHPEWWHSLDEQATETEVSELFRGLTAALQPELVLETGTHLGMSTKMLAQQLELNGHGRIVSLEIEFNLAMTARGNLAPLTNVEVVNLPSTAYEFDDGDHIDFALLDSGGGKIRELEFVHFRQWMSERTIVCFHDTAPHQVPVRESVEKMTQEGLIVPVFLPTPRGVAICQVL